MGLNVCNIYGHMGGDPEIRQTQGGKPVANFRIACNRDYKNADGTKTADWFQCVCYGPTAEYISRYGKRGRAVIITGRLQTREWTDNGGVKHAVTEVLINNAYFTDSPPQNEEQREGPNSGYQGVGQNQQNAPYQQGQSAGYGGGYGGYGGGGYGRGH